MNLRRLRHMLAVACLLAGSFTIPMFAEAGHPPHYVGSTLSPHVTWEQREIALYGYHNRTDITGPYALRTVYDAAQVRTSVPSYNPVPYPHYARTSSYVAYSAYGHLSTQPYYSGYHQVTAYPGYPWSTTGVYHGSFIPTYPGGYYYAY